MPSKKVLTDSIKAAQERVEQAVINRNKFHNLKKLKPYQSRWQYERAIKLSHEFEELADAKTWVKFWTRDNVVADIESGDVMGVADWLASKIWMIDQGLVAYQLEMTKPAYWIFSDEETSRVDTKCPVCGCPTLVLIKESFGTKKVISEKCNGFCGWRRNYDERENSTETA